MDRPVTFIEAGDKDGFRLNPAALQLLESITKPVAVISVVGKYRTGKSFLLNRILLNRKSGFGVGPTINACTKGIWMWGEPIYTETSDGEECAVILLDTEGLGALDEDANHDTRIFLLALLLASTFIYNSVGSLDESALNNLSLIVNLTKQLQVRTAGIQDVDEISAYFPSLLWVLRDFALQLIDKSGNEITPKDYLENALMPQKGVSDNVEQKNRIRRYIKHFFKERDCFPLVRPSESEEILQNLDNAEEEVLRGEFVTQINQLRKYIYRRIKIKFLNGKKVTGSMLASLASSYISAINGGSIPNIDSAWNYMCKSECDRLTSQALSSLQTSLSQFTFPVKNDDLKERYKTEKEELVMRFRLEVPGDRGLEYEKALKGKLKEVYERVKEGNEKVITSECEKICGEFHRETLEKLRKGEYEQLSAFKRDLDAFTTSFQADHFTCPSSLKKLFDHSQRLLIEVSDYLQRHNTQETLNQHRRITHTLELTQSQLSQSREEFSLEIESLKSKLEKSESEKNTLKATIVTLNMQIDEHLREKKRVDERLKERVEELKQDHSERTEDWKKRVEDAMRQMTELQGKHVKEIAALERDKALLEQELKYRREECEDLKTKRSILETEMKNMRREIRIFRENQIEAQEGNLNEENEVLKEEIRDLKDRLNRRTAPRTPDKVSTTDSVREINRLKAELERVKSSRDREEMSTKTTLVDGSSDESYREKGEIRRYEVEGKSEISELKRELKRVEEEKNRVIEELNSVKVKMEGQNTPKDLVQKSVSLQCRLCGKVIIHQLFSGHYRECEATYNRKLSENEDYILIWIPQVVLDRKGEEKFVVCCKRKDRVWQVYRSFEAFRKLQGELERRNPGFEYPGFAEVLRSTSDSIYSKARGMSQDEKLKGLERYLAALCNSPIGGSTEILQFLG